MGAEVLGKVMGVLKNVQWRSIYDRSTVYACLCLKRAITKRRRLPEQRLLTLTPPILPFLIPSVCHQIVDLLTQLL